MQRPLDPDILCALVREGGYKAGDSSWIASTKARFAEQNMSQAVLNLIMSFGMFRPYPHIHCWEWKDYGPHDWSIDFGNRPFTHLTIRPDPDQRAFIKVFENDKHIQTFELLCHPEQWRAFIEWLWNYGNDRLLRQAAVEARRKASRRHPKPQVSYGHLRSNASRKHPAQKDPPGLTLHKPLRSKFSKAQVSKSKGNFKPSRLGMASLTLADVEREAGEDQTLQEKDPNGRITVVSPTKHPADDAGLKTLDGDLLMAGQE